VQAEHENGSMRFPRSIRLAVPMLGLCLAGQRSLNAQEQTISQMDRTSWTGRDGAPQGNYSLAQTPDGILWINSFGGVFTFDGIKFDSFHPKPDSPPLPRGALGDLFVSKEGDLWDFTLHGPAIRIHEGEVRVYKHIQGEASVALSQPQENSSGTLWAILNEKHPVELGPDGVWRRRQDSIQSPGVISKLFIDSSDTQWVIQNDELYRRSKDETEFTATGIHVYGQARIAQSRDHTLWLVSLGPGPAGAPNLQHIDQLSHKLFAPRVHGTIDQIMAAQDGSLWISKEDGGGMSESAQRIGADFNVKSAPVEGVQVSIVVPAARAYVRNHRFRSLFRGPVVS
jgi:ligand-binding sensor domain-containing protein